MPERHLKQSRFTIVLPEHLLKINKENKQKFKKTGETKHIYRNDFVFNMIWLNGILKI